MSQQSKFPKRPLNQTLDMNSPADPQDVLDVKAFLHRKGLYDIPEYGLTRIPIKNFSQAYARIKKKKA